MPNRFPIYELFLRLYPKRYRQQYADQMVQTLADMLEDQSGRSGRLMVWLRASSELPVGIVQQNITSIGEKSMNKLAATTNKRLAIIAGVLIVIVAAVALHKWTAYTAIPNSTGFFYKNGIHATLLDQNRQLTNPMATLYGGLPGGLPLAKYDCNTQAPKGIPMTVYCQSTMRAYAKLPQDDTGKQRILQDVATIEAALKAQGYHGGGNGVTLSSLVSGTYEGKDYSPDAYYEKVVDKRYDCVFDTTVAYANPQPAAISTQFWCTRSINLLGIPHHNTYQSGKGTPAY
ncbi:MAG TPA: hypothetical protein VLF59_01355 [Candidatus Saccharimonadales bacterium]|nr:hypothetical protein [Candidatus Saccharimonadales bacterium]